MIRVVILGYGNVGQHLSAAFYENKNVELVQIYNRSKVDIPDSIENVSLATELSEIEHADVYIIALPDDSISGFSAKLSVGEALVVHTSGGVSITQLAPSNKRGVFYPLQSFSEAKKIDFKSIPICIEAEEKDDLKLLRNLGECISDKVVAVNSEERAQLHLAAVFVNNFVNHLYHISENILSENKLDFDLLKPLIIETAHKIEKLSPKEAQTGPAIRNDLETMQKHLDLLKGSQHKEIYEQLTHTIQETYGKKL